MAGNSAATPVVAMTNTRCQRNSLLQLKCRCVLTLYNLASKRSFLHNSKIIHQECSKASPECPPK